MSALRTRGLYVITDCDRLTPEQCLSRTARILETGVALLQYRNKIDAYPVRRAQAVELLGLCRRFATPFIVNDDIELAADIGADGVHVGRDDAPCSEARVRLGPRAVIGVSCYDSLELARAAQRAGASYAAFGAFFPTATKAARASPPISLLRDARRALDIPIAAIGGINPENAGSLLGEGADLLAVVSAVYGVPDPAHPVRAFNALFESPVRRPA